ncbi:MAG: aminoacyl-tRNA hydrolase, partial [Clostridia bacterium]|nr:aminoacyl-tRNA hydrolase [Clostridia bacterium]
LPSNKLRIRRQGSDGGHRGLRSIITLMNTDNFPRLKIGVSDRDNPKMDLKDWVVGDFTDKELDALEERFPDIYDIAELFVSDNLDKAMARYN